MKFFLSVFILLVFSLGFPSPTLARHGQILGVSVQTTSSTLPLSEGPGLLLPNSPFYFIDLWRDNLNLLLASFNPPTKARLHLKIAAERIVEVKMMLELRGVTPAGLDTAFANIIQNIEGAKLVLKTEKNRGRNIQKLAAELNQTIDNQQAALKIVAKISDDGGRLKIKAVEKAIEDDEVEIEDELPESELEVEIEKELEQALESGIKEASEAAQGVELIRERQKSLRLKKSPKKD